EFMKKIVLTAALLPLLVWAQESSYTNYSSSFNQSAFIPDIALIVDTTYTNRNIKESRQGELSLLATEYPEYVEFNTNNGFNLNYAELSLHSDVDQLFILDGVFHFNTAGVEIEEVYFTTRALPWNLRLKGGKFKSDLGRFNHQHQHMWDFADAPLVYTTFLSPEGLNNTGLQLQWLAPTPWYMMAGVELMQSGNGASFSNDTLADSNRSTGFEAARAPALAVGYLKNSFDIDDTTLLLGISAASGDTKSVERGFDGTTKLYGADLLVKSYFDSYSYLSWQSELLYRHMSGRDVAAGSDRSFKQAGGYSQIVYGYNRNWRSALRYDKIFKNEIDGDKQNKNLDKYTLMAEYNPSEFSRLRAQYSHSSAFEDATTGTIQDINEFILELNIAIGSHGAHAF
ncbi:MAG: hypothetical protein MUP09_05190, partial [Thiovulaceae bacterium]|nr:hypothetical protein [Sulfurimonadaceae bacterium]